MRRGASMFWRKKRGPAAPPQIGCFGKLPATGDFIRLNAGADEVAAFDRWLGASIDLRSPLDGAGFEQSYPPAVGLFVFRPRARTTSRRRAASWALGAASGDNAGRLYPMTVFGSYDYGQLCSTGAALPIALWPLLTAAYDVATRGAAMMVDVFLERSRADRLPSLEDPVASSAGYRAWLATQSMKALWDTGFGTPATRFWVLQNIRRSVDPFRGHEMPKTGLCLRLPLGAGDAYAASVWMNMTLRLARWQNTLSNAFWSPQRACLLHSGPPHVAPFAS